MDSPTSGSTLHDDAAVAAIVWAKFLPSFTGKIICPSTPHVSSVVMSRSLALIQSETPFKDLTADDVWALLTAYEEDLANWEDVYNALRSTFAP